MYAIIPAGGAGTRLWPLSREAHPKFLADLTGSGATMLQDTARRLAGVATEICVVTGTKHYEAVRVQLDGVEVFVEPSPRDSMAAIGLAAAVYHHRHGNVIVGSFAADHHIQDAGAFRRAVHTAIEAAEAGYLVTLGIEATSPSSAYGYIQMGAELDIPGARAVDRFVEKPTPEVAAEYLADGNYVWNAGMFVVQSGVLLESLRVLHPSLYEGLTAIAEAWDTPAREQALADHWGALPKIAIDHALAEPLADDGGVATVPVSMGWSDVGDFASLADLGAPGDRVIAVNCSAAHAWGTGKPVVVVGIDGAIVVETPDAVLVTTREHAQDVKNVGDMLDECERGYLR